MLRLRPYKPSDAKYLLDWLQEERTLALWKAGRFTYPLTEEQLERYLKDFTADPLACIFTLLDEGGIPLGHFSFRNIDLSESSAHMGFIIVNPASRGRGCGRQMVSMALSYAFELLGIDKVTLGVYDCNKAAEKCYQAVGFKDIDKAHEFSDFHGETWEYRYMAAVKSAPIRLAARGNKKQGS